MSTISDFERDMAMVQELMVYDPDSGGPRMTPWEITFVESLDERACDLSEKQAEILARIWRKCFG